MSPAGIPCRMHAYISVRKPARISGDGPEATIPCLVVVVFLVWRARDIVETSRACMLIAHLRTVKYKPTIEKYTYVV